MTGIRLNIVVEGQTEEDFVNDVLAAHLGGHAVWTNARLVQPGKSKGRVGKGGLVKFHKLRGDLKRWCKEDQGEDARFTTMVDLYGYPKDAPGYADAQELEPYPRVQALESALADDIDDRRFVPYIQLHEFETILFADMAKWGDSLIGEARAIEQLRASVSTFDNIELINDGQDTAPSKRIAQAIHAYDKVAYGPSLTLEIGLAAIREKCKHFDEWLTRLEALADSC